MEPRQIDAALAEHLFGFAEIRERQVGRTFKPTLMGIVHIEGTPDNMRACLKVPHYSTTGDGMLMVIEAMRERRWVWEGHAYPQHQTIKLYPSQPDSTPPYEAVFALDREPWTRARAHADTAPRAAGLAALAALGVSVEGD